MSRLSNTANAESLQGSMSNQAQGLKLPFAAPTLWWKNGNPDLSDTEEITDARRFGGWGISKEELDELKGKLPPELPTNWKYFDNLRNAQSKTYQAFLARNVYAALIDRRYTWTTFEGKSQSKVNYLCYLAVRSEKKLLPWGAVVLQGSSYSGKAIDDAVSKFKAETGKLRGDDPVNLFYIPLGTFGGTPKFDPRTGKSGKSTSISPCQLFVPEGGFTSQTMDEWFVGDDVAADMGLLRIQAKEWLHEWDKKDDLVRPANQEEPDFMKD